MEGGVQNLAMALPQEQQAQAQIQAEERIARAYAAASQKRRDEFGERWLLMSIVGRLPKFKAKQGEIWKNLKQHLD